MTPELINEILKLGPTGAMLVALGFMLRYLIKFYEEVRAAEKARTDALMTQVTAHLEVASQVVSGLRAVITEAREMIRDMGDHKSDYHSANKENA